MVSLIRSKPTTKSLLEEGEITSLPRTYLGMSGLGHKCNRKHWLNLRWCVVQSHSRRMGRLFARGHREEKHIIADLSRIGIVCSSLQQEVVACFGHSKGHNDGCAVNVPEAPKTRHLLEFKTMSKSTFTSCKKKGVKVSKPIYYVQVQLYMHMLKLTRTLWIAVCKDNDEYHIERIRYDKEFAKKHIRRGEDIVLSKNMPAIQSPFSSTHFECKWCEAYKLCYGKQKIAKSCRSCKFVGPALDGEWECSKYQSNIPLEFQRKGCNSYEVISDE